MAGDMKKLGIIVFLLILLPVLSSCEGLESNADPEYNYLNISANNQYGFEMIEPDLGRYRYENGSIVEIDFEVTDGYSFLGWQGADGGDVIADGEAYRIQMDEDKEIRLALKLENFKPLEIDFSGVDPIAFEDADKVTGVPHNLEEVELRFNNALFEDNQLEVRIENSSNDGDGENAEGENIEPDNIEIDGDTIRISLVDWRGRFYVDEGEENYLEFAEDYQLIVESPYDVDNREYQTDQIVVNFKVEEPYPEVPGNLNFNQDKAELSWRRSRANAKIDLEEYVEKYIVYKFVGESDFAKADAEPETFEVTVTNPESNDNKVIRFEGEISDTENIYYRVSAINGYGNESDLSEVIGAE